MLVIRRRCGEMVSIGPGIQVEILEIAGNQVKLGISAPREVVILRHEIEVTRRQNESASQGVEARTLDGLLAHLRRPG